MDSRYQADHFESSKNWKATGYTALICALLLFLLFYLSWTLPSQPTPQIDEGLEVNLGNSDQGSGNQQPFLPGQPAPQSQTAYTPQKAVVETEKAPVKTVETDEKSEEEPVVKNPPVEKPKATRITPKEPAKSKPPKAVKPQEIPTPAPPRPKAVFNGAAGTGTGGNDADHFKAGGSEGIAGGTGDQGRPGGDPNSKNYTGGGHGNSGVIVSRGLQGRKMTHLPSFTDDFNEDAKIAMDIRVDEQGNVTDATYDPRGSTSSSSALKTIAASKAKQIKFNATGQESTGTLIFNFRLHN